MRGEYTMDPLTMVTGRNTRLLGVFAHPDDEVFCAGGTLAHWAAAGNETMVVSATRGEAGQIQDAHAATRLTLGAARERELRVACRRLGVERVECLDFRDGTLRDVDESTLAREVAARIRAFGPDVVITFGPDGGYGHPDHIAISNATTQAVRLTARASGYLPHLYYSVFPRQHRLFCHRLARWLMQRSSSFRGSEAFVQALALLAEEAALLGYTDDMMDVSWFPAGFSITEQGEPGTDLYVIVSGHAEVIREDAGGTRQLYRQLGPGEFFGEEALARRQPQNASVVATDTVTCLVLSTRAPTPFDGRGAETRLGSSPMTAHEGGGRPPERLTHIDVSAWLDRKIAALAAHRTQFLMEPAVFPPGLLEDLLGHEYFARAGISIGGGGVHAGAEDGMRATAPRKMAAPA